MTILTPATARELRLAVTPSETILVGPSGDRLPVEGKARLTIAREYRYSETTILVVSGTRTNLLGRPEIVRIAGTMQLFNSWV